MEIRLFSDWFKITSCLYSHIFISSQPPSPLAPRGTNLQPDVRIPAFGTSWTTPRMTSKLPFAVEGMGLVWPLVSCLSLAPEGGSLRACCVYKVPSTGFVKGGKSHGGSSPTYELHTGGAAAHPLCFSTEELHPCPLMIPKCPPERLYEDTYVDGGDPRP